MVTGKPQKPSKFARLVLYPLAAVVFFALLTIVLALASGYRFDYQDGKITVEKTGMLVVATRPFDASITLDGELFKHRTSFYLLPTRISNLLPGNYALEIAKEGYRTWKTTVEVTSNMVTWANYVLLFPNELEVEDLVTPVGKVIAEAQNGRSLLYSGLDDDGNFSLKSLNSGNLSVTDYWPSTVQTESWLVTPNVLKATYSENSDMILLKLANGDRVEYVISSISNGEVVLKHLNSTFAQNPVDVWWSKASNNKIYIQTSLGISLANIDDTSVAAPILTDVISSDYIEKKIYYVGSSDEGVYTLGEMSADGGNQRLIAEDIAVSDSYSFGYSDTEDVLVVLNNDTKILTAYYIGEGGKNASLELSDGVTSFAWSENGEKIYYYGADFIKRYDWEKNKEIAVALTVAPVSVEWFFDENHYLITTENSLYIMDYNGSNVVVLADFATAVVVLDKSNNNIIYSSTDSAGTFSYHKYIAGF